MDRTQIEDALAGLPLGEIRYFSAIPSTNDVAADWANENPPDLSLVIADEQTAGRGRAGRPWYTPPAAALAFTVVLHPPPGGETFPLLAGAGALAVCDALAHEYGLRAEIKWPNDVLVERRKVCGVLAEAHWLGDRLQALLVGIGINVFPAAVPPAGLLDFPATCVAAHVRGKVDRLQLLRGVLAAFIGWRGRLGSAAFVRAWEERLAFRGQQVRVFTAGSQAVAGVLLGLTAAGHLRIGLPGGKERVFSSGELRLRPGS